MEQYGKQYCNNGCSPQKVAFEYAKNCSEDILNNSTNDFYTEAMSLFAQKFPKPEDYDSNYSYLTCSILFCTYIASQICGLYEICFKENRESKILTIQRQMLNKYKEIKKGGGHEGCE